ncbi:hypothetical protein [Kordia sp.]|uniref:hypothetical protein n=1 Tax=Kordia sp. TaxID=1965332 RepID=UPI003D273A7C
MAWFRTFHRHVKGLEYIIFGRHVNDDYGHKKYAIYKLTRNQLYIDTSEKWHTKHDFGKKYTFRGHKASDEQFEIAKELLHKVPQILYSKKLERYNDNFGGKLQDSLIIALFNEVQKTNIVINAYTFETKKLPKDLRKFRILAETTIKKIELL